MNPDTIETFRVGAELFGGSVIGVLSYFLKSVIADFKERHKGHEVVAADHLGRLAAVERLIAAESAAHARALAEYKLHVSETLATKNELARVLEQVFEKLDRIEDKLDRKVDKPHHMVPA